MRPDTLHNARLEIIGSAAAGIAHDINNQLTLILNHLDSPELGAADIEQVKNAAQRCSSLTSNLLAWVRGEEGRTESMAVRSIDPGEFLANFMAQLAIPSGLELLTSIPRGLPPIAINRLGLERVLHNLVSNACSAMIARQGSGTLRIEASPLAIEVSDSGPGIPPELRSRIFEPFFTTKGEEGTGLGLAIVREVMRRMGGSVAVRGNAGGGACFSLRFRPGSQQTIKI
jgi:signal transduction histidine kinase